MIIYLYHVLFVVIILLTRINEVYLIMKFQPSKNKILYLTVTFVLFTYCSLCFYEENQNYTQRNNAISAAEADQYIPKDLDYTEVINTIKKEEGIPVSEETSKKAQKSIDIPEDMKISQNLTVDECMVIADEQLKEALSIEDKSLKLYHLRQAHEFYKAALAKDEENIEALIGAGMSAAFIGKKSVAKNLLMRAYATYPQNADVHKALGDYSFLFSEFNNAIEYYNLSLLSGNLKDYATNLSTAACYEKLGNIKNAIAYYTLSLQLNPNSDIAKQKLENFEEMEKNGYSPDSRKQENDDNTALTEEEIEKLIMETHCFK